MTPVTTATFLFAPKGNQIGELLSLYHETVGSLGNGHYRVSLIVDKMERVEVGFDDLKIGKFCSVLN